MKSIASILFFCAASALLLGSCDKDETPNSLFNRNDSTFMRKAWMSNFTEITLGQIAADSSTDPNIKQFGQQMVDDHTAAQSQLGAVASVLGIGLTNTLDAQHQLLLDSLMTLKGRAFDSVYIHSQVRDHQATIDFYQEHSAFGLQKDLKQYLYRTLPDITLHFRTAGSLAGHY